MEHGNLIPDLLILYGMAMVIAYLMRQARQPTVVGYLITGVIAGPFGISVISDTTDVETLAEVGVALLLFTIGLELSLPTLTRMKRIVLSSGSIQLGATLLLTFVTLFAMRFSVREGVFWGFLVACSSTAIVIKMLHERGELDSMHGRIVLGILLFQDLCVVPMMALLPALAAPGAGRAFHVLWGLGKSLAVVGGILFGARYLFPPVLRAIVLLRSRELFVIAAIFFALGTAFGAARLGLSLALGAFLAGIVLSESEYGHQIMADILPFRDSFNSLFFISVGMLIDIRFVTQHAGRVGLVVLAMVVGKLLTGGLAVRAIGFPLRMAALVAMALAQVGEFSFVLLHEGSQYGLVPSSHYQIFLAAAVLTMMATPALITFAPQASHWFARTRGKPELEEAQAEEKSAHLEDHVIICGFGINGRRLARLLRENQLPYTVVEMNPKLVSSARDDGENILFGDASNLEILQHAGCVRARTIVFALSDPTVLARAISHARHLNPDLHIIARTKRIEEAAGLRTAGATDVIAEEIEAWMEIVARVLRLYGTPRQVVAAQMSLLRDGDYEMARQLAVPGQPLRHLKHLLPMMDTDIFIVAPGSPLVGRELRELDLRARTGALVLAILREGDVVQNPGPTLFLADADQMLMIGSREQLESAFALLDQRTLPRQS
ncbi:MAG: cation:proton antiporter [Acidobacteria bacterium]|nr:cation:proton antiporter [Acidobacteriota bacterium]